MSIVRMKRFELVAMEADRPVLMSGLQRAGCVHVDEPETASEWEKIAPLVGRISHRLDAVKEDLQTLSSALDVLSAHGALKRSFLAPKRGVRQRELMDSSGVEKALAAAREVLEQNRRAVTLSTENGKLDAAIAGLVPWEVLDVPLNVTQTATTRIWFGYVPPVTSWDALVAKLEQEAPLSQVYPAGSDREGLYFMVLCHVSEENMLQDVLKEFHFTRLQFRDTQGTAKQNIAAYGEQKRKNSAEREKIADRLAACGELQGPLELAYDHLSSAAAREEAAGRLMATERTFSLVGWVPESAAAYLDRALGAFDCVVTYETPGEADDVPVMLRNGPLIEPFNMITEMYSLPKYSNIDPNPLMAPFMAAFFGMMYADLGYGLILILIGHTVLKKKKPVGAASYMWKSLMIGGAFSCFFGILFGGFFGDLIPRVCSAFFGIENIFPSWYPFIDPLNDAVTVVLLALIFGAIHLLFGMGIKAYILIRDGHPWAAVMDIGSWWLVFAGFAVAGLGYGPWVMVAGFACVVLTQGRGSPSIGGKIVGGLGKLYDVTAYLSDVLSYLRLMALALASGVIASVFNILATMGGRTVMGVILFIILVPLGHAFNMAINIIGTYVHASRLQFLEFFSKFYDDGGRPFAPLSIRTKYVDILKEDN